jgi:hypothetical protein
LNRIEALCDFKNVSAIKHIAQNEALEIRKRNKLLINNGRPFVGIRQDLRAISKQTSRETCKGIRDLQVIASPAMCPDTLPDIHGQ